jgi:outer membrane lipoprotein carrier protein
MMRRLLLALLFAVVPLLAPVAHAGGVERLKSFIDSAKTFRANFTQTIYYKSGKKPRKSSGIVVLSRPGKFRWQVEKPYAQLMVGDGTRVWLYDPDLKQVTKKKVGETLGGTPAAILAGEPGQGSEAIEKTFKLEEGEPRDGLEWAIAWPKAKDASFEKVLLGFRGGELAAMEMHDNFGQATVVEFSAVERNPNVPAALFRFNPPPGVDVVGD